MQFDEAWVDLCGQLLGKHDLPDDMELPDQQAVADALGNDWMADARSEFMRRFSALGNLSVKTLPDRHPALFPKDAEPGWLSGFLHARYGREDGLTWNGLSLWDWLVLDDEIINRRLFDGLRILHLYLRTEGTLLALKDEKTDGRDGLIDGFEAVDTLWEIVSPEKRETAELKHPLAALIEGWLLRPVEADERATGILPATLAAVREADGPAEFFDLGEYEKKAGFAPHPIAQAFLPDLAPVGNEIVPAMPLVMWDASTQGGPRPGKGAPLPLRIWIEAVLALPTADRFGTRRVSVRYGDLVDWLMPNGEYRKRNWPAVQTALHRVHNLRLPWELPDGRGGSRAVVIVRDMPRVWNAYDDQVIFEISLPPGVNERGPLVYRPALRRLGQQSAMRYRAKLSLSWLWDRYGARNGKYTQPTRPLIVRDGQDRMLEADGAILLDKNGQPARTYKVPRKRNGQQVWIDRPGIVPLDADGRHVPTLEDAAQERNPAADRYPVLTPAQLVELCYPLDRTGKQLTRSARSRRRDRAQKAIQLMAGEGYCIVEDADGGFRILPPQGWGARYAG